MKRLPLLLLVLAGPALPGALGCAFCGSPPDTTAPIALPAGATPVATDVATVATPSSPQAEGASVFRRIPIPHTFTFM